MEHTCTKYGKMLGFTSEALNNLCDTPVDKGRPALHKHVQSVQDYHHDIVIIHLVTSVEWNE